MRQLLAFIILAKGTLSVSLLQQQGLRCIARPFNNSCQKKQDAKAMSDDVQCLVFERLAKMVISEKRSKKHTFRMERSTAHTDE